MSEARASDTKRKQQLSLEQLLEPMRTPLPRQRVSHSYHLGLLLVTFGMLLLPVIYLGLIGAIGYAVYLHAVYDFGIIKHGPIGRMIVFTVIYVMLLVAGPIAIAFMFKPFFAPKLPVAVPLTLERAQQPAMFAFIEALCACVGAPSPTRIDVDCEVNAAAGLRRGWRSLFSQDLVLTIGLPLVSGMSLRQFAGVLAHEFGHFAQSGGMRLTYVIGSINDWFARVVYQRDQWDQKLEEWTTESAHDAVKIIA